MSPYTRTRKVQSWIFVLAVFSLLLVSACGGPARVEFATKHISDETGEQLQEIVSFSDTPGLDNSENEAPLQIQIEFERNYRHQIISRLTNTEVSEKAVQDKIVEFYKLPPNDPEGTVQTAKCPISVVIPPEHKSIVTVEWTERWAEGVVNKGKDGSGERIGTYSVFLGYIEPCSLINQENLE